ncbi:MAG TPA: SIMPL domain-containing protein [Vicinamibacteria bacterium]|nr:SIMPL domain-containing protein [Vicinamibacteria bacterium]
MRIHFLLLAAFSALRSPAAAQTSDSPQIRVTGRATVSVAPEEASVDVGVVTEAPEAKDAARLNAQKLDFVLKAIRNALGSGANFETVSYSLNPVYRYPEPRTEPVLRGYSASNVVRVKELALDKVGEVIDLATSSGANSVSNIAFGLRDEAAAKARALREAAIDAKAKADALADALGVQVLGILSVSEGEPDIIRPLPTYRAEMAMAQAAPPTPVEAGAIEVRASVTLSVAFRP